jgi:hypothetical protein
MIRLLLSVVLLAGGAVAAQAGDDTWQSTTWNGERAFVSTALGWKAVVSLDRGRLMYFGAATRELNLLLAPPSRANRDVLGGHRLWLGPQATWAKGWPPPDAWEYSAPESFANAGGVLRLLMPTAGDGWPRLTRTYRWDGPRLVCGAEISGGTRAAQIIQIFQVPPHTIIAALARPEEKFPSGYVELPSTAGPFAARFAQPRHVTRADNALTLRHTGEVVKCGFRPQVLTGTAGDFVLLVRREAQSGTPAGEPDEGFFSQVYLSSGEQGFIELEQLSPLFAPGTGASFATVLEARPR